MLEPLEGTLVACPSFRVADQEGSQLAGDPLAACPGVDLGTGLQEGLEIDRVDLVGIEGGAGTDHRVGRPSAACLEEDPSCREAGLGEIGREGVVLRDPG